MKKKLFFIATTLYSNAQAVRSSIKSVGYAIFAFVVSSIMLLAPISISRVTTSGESLTKTFGTSEYMLYEFIMDLNNKGTTCSVNNGKFSCAGNQLIEKEFITIVEQDGKEYKYAFVVLDDDYDYKTVNEEEAQDNDNLVYFGEDTFYLRKATRNKNGDLESSLTLTGSYKYVGNFDFENVTTRSSNETSARAYLHTIYSDFLYSVSLSDFSAILLIWFILAIIVLLICVLSGGFIIYYGNKKGNLADEYGFRGSLKIACNLLLMPAILSVLVGLFMPESVIITAPIIFFIRTFVIYRAQFTKKGQKLAIKTHKGLEDFID